MNPYSILVGAFMLLAVGTGATMGWLGFWTAGALVPERVQKFFFWVGNAFLLIAVLALGLCVIAPLLMLAVLLRGCL